MFESMVARLAFYNMLIFFETHLDIIDGAGLLSDGDYTVICGGWYIYLHCRS